MVHLRRNPHTVRQDVLGDRIGDVTVVCVRHPYTELRCDRGHKSFKQTSYIRQAKRDGGRVRCSECVKVARGEVRP